MDCGHSFSVNQQLLITLLTRPEASSNDLDITIGVLGIAKGKATELYQLFSKVFHANWRSHIEQKHVATFRKNRGL